MSNFFPITLRLFLISFFLTVLFYVGILVLDRFFHSRQDSPLKFEGYTEDFYRNLAGHERKIYQKSSVKLQKILAISTE